MFGKKKSFVLISTNSRSLNRFQSRPVVIQQTSVSQKIAKFGNFVKEAVMDVAAQIPTHVPINVINGPSVANSKSQDSMSPNQDLAVQYQATRGAGQSGDAGNSDSDTFFRAANPPQQSSSYLCNNGQTNLGLPDDAQ